MKDGGEEDAQILRERRRRMWGGQDLTKNGVRRKRTEVRMGG